jgi:hypothetical protein
MDYTCSGNVCVTISHNQPSGWEVLAGALLVLAVLGFIGWVISRD